MFKELEISRQIQKTTTFNILSFVIILIISLNIFLVYAIECSMLISLSNVSKLTNGHFSILSLFWWPFLLAHLS